MTLDDTPEPALAGFMLRITNLEGSGVVWAMHFVGSFECSDHFEPLYWRKEHYKLQVVRMLASLMNV